MPDYVVFAPGTGINLVAGVEAPSTKHARTVYLDYLSRNGQVSWNQRQELRKHIKVMKDTEGAMDADIYLDYDMEGGVDVERYEPEDFREPMEGETYYTEQGTQHAEEEMYPVESEYADTENKNAGDFLANVPIANLSRASGGL